MFFLSIVRITLDSPQKQCLNQDHFGSSQLSRKVFTKPLEADTQRKQCCPRAFTSVVERYCLFLSLFMLYLSAVINLRCIFDSLHKVYVRKSFDGGLLAIEPESDSMENRTVCGFFSACWKAFSVQIKGKVNFTLEQVTKAHKGSTGIALLFL